MNLDTSTVSVSLMSFDFLSSKWTHAWRIVANSYPYQLNYKRSYLTATLIVRYHIVSILIAIQIFNII